MYFTQEFGRFFKELAANNNRDWFHENKKRYTEHVKDPFYHLVADVIERIRKHDSGLQLEVKNAVFRINRDIRFSKDKTPYKLNVSAVISDKGRKDMQAPGIYLQVGVDELAIGGGAYMPDKENLHKIRSAIASDPRHVEALLRDKKFNDMLGGLAESEKNKILPKEFKEAGEKNPLLFNKQFYFMKFYEGENYVIRPDLDEFIEQHYLAARSWNEFLEKAIK